MTVVVIKQADVEDRLALTINSKGLKSSPEPDGYSETFAPEICAIGPVDQQ